MSVNFVLLVPAHDGNGTMLWIGADMAESLFGGIRFDRLADSYYDEDDDDDDVYGSRASEFETESLSSSSDEEAELEAWPVMLSLAQRQLRKRRHISTSEDSSTDVDMEETPMWFFHGPFKYNGRIGVLALPGSMLALLFAGEL